ncbi:cytochrome P450 [Schizophyllum commune H4-8]|uniref:Cytochrome P450 n=1 Tax=Schizophyllum commune (strain H4-8 / FGSC 9210) TaxID=578458 RepID=D8Q4W4_SCHCM|nr:cytochrome P450 [Schizophyllum commune H4-8]KAI5892439.1 cytochrome P450 [Schizophyllum commune H4-8]
MFAKAFLTLASLIVARLFWRFVNRFVLRTPLDNIPGPASPSVLTGNFQQLYSVSGWEFHAKLAREYGSVVRLTGPLGERQLYVGDPKALHHIVVKDQDVYEEHPQFISTNSLIFGNGLLSTQGDKHKKQRKLMNPVFSTAHMRNMIPIFYEVVDALRATLEKQTDQGPLEIDLLYWMGRTATELIGRSGLGYSFDSLAQGAPEHPYATSVKEYIPTMFRLQILRVYVLPKVYNLGPAWLRRAVVNLIPSSTMHALRDMSDLMWNTSKEIYSQKVAALQAGDAAVAKQVGQGKDLLSLLIRENMKAGDPLPEEELLAQLTTLVFAAMDTTSSALSRTSHLLATHPEVQDRLRAEIRAAMEEHGQLSYNELESLPYLDAVCRETLRLYPPAPQLLRRVKKDVVLPFSKPIIGEDGREMSEVLVPAGTVVVIAIMNANRNKEIWGEDADEWKPERWLEPLPASVTDAHIPGVYGNLMTFLGGGRACIGFKFSQLEMKVVLVELLNAFKFSLSEKEVSWRMSNIVSPFIKEQPEKSQLPIIISKAD